MIRSLLPRLSKDGEEGGDVKARGDPSGRGGHGEEVNRPFPPFFSLLDRFFGGLLRGRDDGGDVIGASRRSPIKKGETIDASINDVSLGGGSFSAQGTDDNLPNSGILTSQDDTLGLEFLDDVRYGEANRPEDVSEKSKTGGIACPELLDEAGLLVVLRGRVQEEGIILGVSSNKQGQALSHRVQDHRSGMVILRVGRKDGGGGLEGRWDQYGDMGQLRHD
jgi:hypothetical protein